MDQTIVTKHTTLQHINVSIRYTVCNLLQKLTVLLEYLKIFFKEIFE